MAEPADITAILLATEGGGEEALNRLFQALYVELRGLAAAQLAAERGDHTLQPTALIHEAYLKLIDQTRCRWQNRAQFLAIASRVMRRILVDHARGRGRQKRGGDWKRVTFDQALSVGTAEQDGVLLAVDEALGHLEASHPDHARVVEMRFFGGLSQDECAAALGLSVRTIARHWAFAQAWLYRDMLRGADPA